MSSLLTQNPADTSMGMDRAAVGRAIRARRDACGLTLRAASERCGVSYAMLGQIETGYANTTVDKLIEIAEGLDCELTVALVAKDAPPGDGASAVPPDLRQDVSDLLSALTSPDESMASRARVGLELLVSGLKGGGH